MENTENREAVSLEEVARAHAELLADGIEPSVRKLRSKIGRGSYTTISNLKKQVELGGTGPEEHVKRFAPELYALCSSLIDNAEQVATTTLAKREQELDALEASAKAQIQDAESKVSRLHRELQQEQTYVLELKASIRSLEGQNTELAMEKQQLITEVSELRTKHEEAVARAVRAEADAERARTQRDHYEERMMTQREQELAAHRLQLDELHIRLDDSRKDVTRRAEEASKAQEALRSLQQHHLSVRNDADKLSKALESARNELSDSKVMNAELASRISQMEEKLADVLMAHDKTREEALLLRQDCAELKDELQNLHSVRVSASSVANQCVQAVAELVERGIAEEASDHTLGRLRKIESSLHGITEALELTTAPSARGR